MAHTHASQLRRAQALLQQQQFHGVVELCTQVLKRDKRNAQALHLLGRAYFGMSRYDEAAKALDLAVRAEPGDSITYAMLGEINIMRTRYAAGLRHFDRAIKLDPTNRNAVVGKAWAYDRMKQDDKLAAYLEPHMQGDAVDPRLLIPMINMLERADRHVEAIDLLNAREVNDTAPDTWDMRMLLLHKGRLHEKIGQYEEAFHAYMAGQRRGQPRTYQPERVSARVDRLIEIFSTSNLGRLPVAANDIRLPVFIVGMPRTGSTLVERIISAHPQANEAGEIPLLSDVIRDIPNLTGAATPYPDCVMTMTHADVDTLGRHYATRLTEYDPRASHITDKMLNNYMQIGLLSRILPHARVIHCRRDPLDTCLSILSRSFNPGMLPYQASLEWLGHQYRQYERMMRHWATVLPETFITIQYEELVDNQEALSRTIIDSIGLPWDDRCLEFYRQKHDTRTTSVDQVNQPIYRTSVARAQHFGARLDPLRAALAAPD
jgi:Tfp pilus assembly protein PilF